MGVSKGAAMDRIIASAVGKVSSRRSTSEFAREGVQPVDFVLCMGHFLGRDEDIFAYFEDCMEGAKYRNSEKERQAAWEANAAMVRALLLYQMCMNRWPDETVVRAHATPFFLFVRDVTEAVELRPRPNSTKSELPREVTEMTLDMHSNTSANFWTKLCLGC